MPRLLLALVFFVFSTLAVTAQEGNKAERRIAFVVGNESYADGALPTAANDAGLIAQTLQAAGFEVVGARDLDAETLRQSYSDFLRRVSDAGPGAVAFVYMSGYGLQYGNDNYYVPIGANVSRDADIPIAAIRLSDLTGPLDALGLKARFMVFDAAYAPPFRSSGPPLAGGLALADPSPGSLVAYNAAPGTLGRAGKDNYGIYAQSLAAELREGGLSPDEIFDRVRLRVNEATKGATVPWDASKIDSNFVFFDRGPGAPPAAASRAESAALIQKPLRDLPPKQAYVAAVARDTVQAYSAFDEAYPDDPLNKRVRILLAARREALTWRRTVASDTPAAYWSYLQRYPRGPHAAAARLRLGALSAALDPPADFGPIDYDVPPPPEYELGFVDRPVIAFDDPDYDLAPPPPPPEYWLPPVPVEFVDLPPPPEPDGLFFLPVPAFVPLPAYYNPPGYVVLPAEDRFFARQEGDRRRTIGEGGVGAIHQRFPAGAGVAAGAAAVALPAAAVARAAFFQQRGITTPAQLRDARRGPGGLKGPGGPPRPGVIAPAQRLPGANGQALPPNNMRGRAERGQGARGAAERGPNATGPGDHGAGERGTGARNPVERGPVERGAGARGAGERGPGARNPGERGPAARPGAREPGERGPAERGPGARGSIERGPGARGPGERGAGERGAGERGSGARSPERGPGDSPPERSPGARGPGGRGPGERGPGERRPGGGPGAREPGERGPEERGPGARGPIDRGFGPGARGPGERGVGERGPRGLGPGGPGPGARGPIERGPGGPAAGGGRPPGGGMGGPPGGGRPGGMGGPPGGGGRPGGPGGGRPGGGGPGPGAGGHGGGQNGGPGGGRF